MIFTNQNPPRIVRSYAGQGTDEVIRVDNEGRHYRMVSEAEARMIESGTAGRVYRIDRYGNVR